MDRAQLDGGPWLFGLSIVISAVVAGAITWILDPPIVEEPVVGREEALLVTVAIAFTIALIPIVSISIRRGWSRISVDERGQATPSMILVTVVVVLLLGTAILLPVWAEADPSTFSTTADPTIPWEPFALSAVLTIVLSPLLRRVGEADRGQIGTETFSIAIPLTIAGVVALIVGAEIVEEARQIPPGADVGAPPTFTIEGVLIAIGLLVVLGGVVVLSRRVGE